MAIISGTIKAETFTKSAGGSIVINTVDPEQLNRIERKLDRVLELLENKELPISVETDGKKVSKIIVGELTPNLRKQISSFNDYKN